MTSKNYTVQELYKVLGAIIDDGFGNREFQIYYNNECKWTAIPKGSRVEIINGGIRFTDKDDGECHIKDLEDILYD